MFDAQSHRTVSAPGNGSAGAWLVRIVCVGLLRMTAAIDTMMVRRRTRLQLQSLDDRMLKDIGVSRADVVAESCKPFWRE